MLNSRRSYDEEETYLIDTKLAQESYIKALSALDTDDRTTIKFLMMTVAALIEAIDTQNDYDQEYSEFRESGGLK